VSRRIDREMGGDRAVEGHAIEQRDHPGLIVDRVCPASWRKLTKQWNQALSIDVDPATP
jgi:hypothetical protein